MNNQVKKPIAIPISGNAHSFDFEVWVRLVKPQLLAAVRKKANKHL